MKEILLGQALSLAITLSGFVNEYLFSTYKLNFSAIQTSLFYTLLILIFLPIHFRSSKQPFSKIVKDRGLLYLLYAFLDCAASIAVIHTYSYLGLSLIALLSTSSTPLVMIFSKLFLKTSFKTNQYAGAILCISGVVFLSVMLGVQKVNSRESIFGSVLMLASSVFYAASNVAAEVLSRDASGNSEFLSLVGIFGLGWSLLYLFICSYSEIPLLLGQPFPIYALILVYAVSIVIFYSIIPIFLKNASATLFNLSLFTINIYSFLVSYLFFSTPFIWAYPVSFAFVTFGILAYSL